MTHTTTTQLDKANAVLKDLARDVTSSDRAAAYERYAKNTVNKYLKGEGTDVDTAVDLIGLFRTRISGRNLLITGTEEKRA